jgi:hypothetical protein
MSARPPKLTRLSPNRDYVGRLLMDPARLSRLERFDLLRQMAGAMQVSNRRETAWLGRALGDWLHYGGDLAKHLDLHSARGSHLTLPNLLRQEEQDRALIRLSVLVGGDTRALKILRGELPCPPLAAALVAELQDASKSSGAVTRARRRLARHGR